MSKPNEKNATAQASSAADGASDLALVQPTPAASAQGDENHGRGGMYVVVDGVRKRIAGTEPAAVVTASKELQ